MVDTSPSEIPTCVVPDADNFRSELARHRLSREDVCSLIGMHVNLFSMYRTRRRKLSSWAAHNIGYGINLATGLPVFDVDMERGLMVPSRRPDGTDGARARRARKDQHGRWRQQRARSARGRPSPPKN